MVWIMKKGMESERPKLAANYKETAPGVYDTRDLAAIRKWAEELASIYLWLNFHESKSI
jgi:hypothetical protein